jgi:hypothetical protein
MSNRKIRQNDIDQTLINQENSFPTREPQFVIQRHFKHIITRAITRVQTTSSKSIELSMWKVCIWNRSKLHLYVFLPGFTKETMG